MSITCFIVDDESHGIKAVADMVKIRPELNLIGTDKNPLDTLNLIVTGSLKVDILFLDIEMPEITGTSFLEIIRNLAVVIFVTGHVDYALKAIQLGAADYITKPIQLPDFLRALARAKEKLVAHNKLAVPDFYGRTLFLRLGVRNIVQQDLQDLIYVSVKDKSLNLYVAGKAKPLTIIKTMSKMEESLPKDMFLRIHKSHIVNMSFVESIVGNRINLLNSKTVLEIGSTYIDAVYSRFDSI